MDTKSEFDKLRKPMTAKRWSFLLVAGAISIMIAIGLVNFLVDPYDYFHPTTGKDNIYFLEGKTYNRRLFNYHYLKEYSSDYGGVILGGSKGMRVSEEVLSELSGVPCRNLTAEVGNFYDYLGWVRWLTESTDIKMIFINLSSLEVDIYSEKERNVESTGYYMPAALDSEKNKLTEFIQYLYRGGIQTSIDYLKAKHDGTISVFDIERNNENDLYVNVESRKLDQIGRASCRERV